jgi:hypothetical protein
MTHGTEMEMEMYLLLCVCKQRGPHYGPSVRRQAASTTPFLPFHIGNHLYQLDYRRNIRYSV